MTAAKKVMHVTIRWGHGVGGVKRFIHNAVEALPGDEYRQVVASLGPVTGDDQGLTVLGPVVQSGRLAGKRGMQDMVRFFETESPDIVHIHCNNGVGLLCAEAARRAGRVARVVHSHNSSLGSDELWKRAGDAVLKLMCSDAPTVRVACSKVAGDWLFGSRPYAVIRNGIDLERFVFSPEQRTVVREALGVPERAFLIGLVGAGIPVKNTSFAIELLAQLREAGRDAHLVLLGEGEESEMLVSRAAEFGVAFWTHFTGTVRDAWRYYSAMDCLVMPSFYEGLPITLIEAQANGLPCVVSDTVSREADVAGIVSFLPLDDCPSWLDGVDRAVPKGRLRCVGDSRLAISQIKQAGYSIEDLGSQLRALYAGQSHARNGQDSDSGVRGPCAFSAK